MTALNSSSFSLTASTFEFNWLPGSYIDETWLADWLTSAALKQIRQNNLASRTLNVFLFEEFKLIGEVQEDECSNQLLQIMLNPLINIHKLILYIGMTLNHTQIRQIICGQEQRKLRLSVGEEAYTFGTNRAAFLIDGEALQGIFSSKGLRHKSDYIGEVMRTGFRLFSLVSDSFSEAVKSRLILKFKCEYADDLKHCWDNGDCFSLASDEQYLSTKTQAETLFIKVTKELYAT